MAPYVGAAVVHLALPIVNKHKSRDYRHLRFPEQYLIYRLLGSKVFIP